MQGRHTTPESFGVQALEAASHESWIYDHCSAAHSLTALAFVSSMSEPLRIKTCCSSVGVHHTAATSSNDHSGMMLPSLHAESHFLSRFVMVRLSWHNKHRHVAQRVGSTAHFELVKPQGTGQCNMERILSISHACLISAAILARCLFWASARASLAGGYAVKLLV